MRFFEYLQGFDNAVHHFGPITPLASVIRRWFQIGATMTGVLAAGVAFSVQPARAFDFDRPLDRGGRVEEYAQRVAGAAAQRHVISGDCMSACTMWLGARHSCVTPDAVLWFHAAIDRVRSLRHANPWRAVSPAGNEQLLRMYPPRVRAVVAPWLVSPEYHTLTGRELAALGVPLCRQRDLAGG